MSAAAGSVGPCGACKFLRRKCVAGCIFAPYFNSEQGAAHFAAVHKVFGASNVSKLLLHIPTSKRMDAVVTICYEAQARLRDPIHGCVAHILALQQQVVNLQSELSYLQVHLATVEQPLFVPPQAIPSVSELPAYELSDNNAVHPTWSLYQRQQVEQFSSGGDLQELARELLNRHAPPPNMPCRDHHISALPPHAL